MRASESTFSSNLRLVTQALHWDRGRPARRERTARTERLELTTLEIIAPYGARSGRAARGPSEELEWRPTAQPPQNSSRSHLQNSSQP